MYIVDANEERAGGTLCSIHDSAGAARQAAIFFPPAFRSGTKANVVVYLHGNIASFDAHLKGPLISGVLREVAAAGKSLVLAIPSVGKVPSAAGWPTGKKEFQDFLDVVLRAAAAQAKQTQTGQSLADPLSSEPLELNTLILAAHSGGGFPMWAIASSGSSPLSNLKECWFLDCLYAGFAKNWIGWAPKNAGVTLDVTYTVFPPEEDGAKQAKLMEAASKGKPPVPSIRSVKQEPSNIHDNVPVNNIQPLIKASTNL